MKDRIKKPIEAENKWPNCDSLDISNHEGFQIVGEKGQRRHQVHNMSA